ncbi:MAG: IS1380 family transposase [Alphaproteobacteria bacterium]
MQTECDGRQFAFEGLEKRAVVASFDGGAITSDAGALLLRETDLLLRMSERVAGCFTDHRDQTRVDHAIKTMVAQRIHGIALGYEDLNDHDDLRHDPVVALHSTTLEMRSRNVAPLAGRSTLNRLEHVPSSPRRRGKSRREKFREAMAAKSAASRAAPAVTRETVSTPAATEHRYHKIDHDPEKLEALFVDFYLDAYRKKPPKLIVLDPDGTDDPIHGNQEGSFFHGYYDCYCYIPLYIFCGHDLLAAKLRSADVDGAAGAKEEIARIVTAIRARWPEVKIIVRADSGFCRDDLLTWCEENRVEYVIGLPGNSRLDGMIKEELQQAQTMVEAQMKAKQEEPASNSARVFKELRYRTRDTWSAERRVVAKAEWTGDKANPRFIVASEGMTTYDARGLYEDFYCARGDMENRIKECQLDLMADRTSAATMRANQLRLWFASFAYVLMTAMRRLGLRHTELENASPGTIRVKLLKIGALVTVSVRRVKVAIASAFPRKDVFALAHCRLRNMAA